MTKQKEELYLRYEGWAIDHGCDTDLIKFSDEVVRIAQINEDGTKWIDVPAEFEDIAVENA